MASFDAAEKKEITLHDATCARCGVKMQVPFVPDPSRNTFCRDCLPIVREKFPEMLKKKNIAPAAKPRGEAMSLSPARDARQQNTHKGATAPRQRRGPDVEGLREILSKSLSEKPVSAPVVKNEIDRAITEHMQKF
ncbi:hypothetical protein HYR65_01445 [Candidatus Azambacteria bacterium]|nr:hypothetical protein [Candidatus Azambacteria bacterium]